MVNVSVPDYPVVEIVIPFDPVPWAAPKLGKGGYVYDIREKDKRAIRHLIKQQYKAPPIEGPVRLLFEFFFAVPKSFSKKKRADALDDKIIPSKCDCTNLQKLYEDCLKKIVIDDDRYVFIVLSLKKYAEKASVKIEVHHDMRKSCA